MATWNYIIAAALLTTPSGVVDSVPRPHCHDSLAAGLHWIALQWEIVDPRELRTLVSKEGDLAAYLELLRGRYRDTAELPLLDECRRFPPRRFIEELLAFNRSYRHDLAARLAVDTIHAEELRAAVREAEYLYRVWNTLRDARCEYYYVLARRQALGELRDLVGPEAFYSGRLPPPVPVWRFPDRS